MEDPQTVWADSPLFYKIQVEGELDPMWQCEFEGMEMTCTGTGETQIRGQVPDQAALHAILARIRDLNLKLVSVRLEN